MYVCLARCNDMASLSSAMVLRNHASHLRDEILNNFTPENMFIPFSIETNSGLDYSHVTPNTHWANVDTGSMVNIMYSGVLKAFPHLKQYSQPFEHVVKGVGNNF